MAKLPDISTFGARPSLAPSGGLSSYRVPESSAGNIVSGAGQMLEHSGRQLEAGGDEIFRKMKVEQDRIDTLRAEEAFTKLRERQLDLSIGEQNGFSRVKGGAADQTLLNGWSKKFTDASKEIEGTLQNDEQRVRFRQRAGAAGVQFQHELLTHIARERDTFAKEVFEGGVRTEVRKATASWNDGEAIAGSLTRINGLVAERADMLQWPKDYSESVRLQEAGKLHSAVIDQAIASGQWEYGLKWYEANKADVDKETAKRLEVAVRDGTQKQLSAGYTADFLAARDNRTALDELEKRISADGTLDETRKNALLGRVMARGETLDRRAEADYNRRVKVVERSINQVNANTLAGYEPNVEQLTPILNAAKGTELEADAKQMVALANATRAFRLSLPQQQEAYITRLEAEVRKSPGKLDIKWVNGFKEIYAKQQAAIQADPTTFAVRQGLVNADTPAGQPLDLTKPAQLGEQLAGRFALARGMQDRYQAPFKPLTKEETDLASGVLKTATVAQKREYFAGLAMASGGDMDGYRAIVAQISPDDPVTAHGGVLAGKGYRAKDGEISVGNGTYVADLIFRGQALLHPNRKEDGSPDKGKLWPMPGEKDEQTMRSVFESEEKGSLAGLGPGRANYVQTARAIYASLSEDARDATGVLDQTRWRQAIRLATGGFTDVGGKRIVLPYGHNEAQFKDGLNARIGLVAAADRLPEGVTVAKLKDLPLAIAGDGKYVFRAGDSVVLDKNDQPIVIDFNHSLPFRPSGSPELPAFDDARRGELGVLKRPDGNVSTELSITVTDPRLNAGKATNIPLLVRGQVDVDKLLKDEKPTGTQVERAIQRAAARAKGGALLPGYDSVEEAEKAARSRPVSEKMKTAK